jgi:Ca2+-binding EF-hand superfamily protein
MGYRNINTKYSNEEIEAAFKYFDKNGDGTIDVQVIACI